MKSSHLVLILLAAVAVAASSDSRAGVLQYSGVNLAGAEFGASTLPGTYGSAYTYPTQAEVDYFKSRGMNTVRLCFRWERLQRTNHAAFDATEFNNRFHPFVSQATAKGMYVILDPHNFARYYPDPANMQSSAQGLIGSATVPNSDFADFWSRLATIYKTNDHVIFNLVNEPNAIQESAWVSAVNDAIVAIRAAGSTNLILVPGNRWTGAWTWSNSDGWGQANSVAMLSIVDSADNFAFDVHQYLDSDGSGTHSTIVSATIGAERLAGFTQWCQNNNRKGFLGEFAVANSIIGAGLGDEAISNILTHIQVNSDVWLGWAWWAAGPWWGSYMFTLEPASGNTDQAAMTVLTNFIVIPPPTLQITNGNKLQFTSWPRFVFQTEASPDLTAGVWTNFGPAITSNGNPVAITLPVGSDPAAFYRVRMHRAP